MADELSRKRAKWDRKSVMRAEAAAGAWSGCQHYFSLKKRHCSLPRKPGCAFCGHHDSAVAGERMACPVDPSHNIWRRDLEAHTARCVSGTQERQRSQLPYY